MLFGRGRPMKYSKFIKALDFETLYGTASVVAKGEEQGLFELAEFRDQEESLKDAKTKVRMAINRLASQSLPTKEDGFLSKKGKQPLRAWYGWRWKRAIPKYYFEEFELNAIKEFEAQSLLRALEKKKASWEINPAGLVSFRKTSFVLALLVAAVVLTAGFISAFYPEGVRVFKEEGPIAAFHYFRGSESFKRRDPVVLFGKAWTKYAIGHFEEAEQDAYDLIKEPGTPEVTVGNCFFLLAKIKTRTGLYHDARDHYQRSQNIFENLNRTANLYKNHIGVAELALESGDDAEAEYYIQLALETYKEAGMEPWDIHHLQAELAFRRGDYQRALEYSYRYYSGYKKAGNLGKTADALIDIGFYLLLTGQWEAGFQKTMEAQVLVNKAGDQDKFYFCMINLIMFRRCEGKSYAAIEEALINQIDEKRDQSLQKLLGFALSFPCGAGPELGGEGDQDPPPNGSSPGQAGEGDTTPPPNGQ